MIVPAAALAVVTYEEYGKRLANGGRQRCLFNAFSGSIVSSVLILAGNFLLSAFCYCYPATNRSPRGAADGEATHKRNKHGTNWGLKRGSRGGLAG